MNEISAKAFQVLIKVTLSKILMMPSDSNLFLKDTDQ